MHNLRILSMILALSFALGTTCSRSRKMRSGFQSNKHTQLDYLDPNSPATIKLNGVEYTLIYDYIQWVHGYMRRDASLLRKAQESLVRALQLEPGHRLAKDQLGKLQIQLARL